MVCVEGVATSTGPNTVLGWAMVTCAWALTTVMLPGCHPQVPRAQPHPDHPYTFHSCREGAPTDAAEKWEEVYAASPPGLEKEAGVDLDPKHGLVLVDVGFELRLFRVSDGALVGRVGVEGHLLRGFLLPCGRHLLTVVQTEGGDAQQIELRTLPSGKVEAAVDISPLPTSNIERSDDGHFLAYVSGPENEQEASGRVVVFDVQLGEVLQVVPASSGAERLDFPRPGVLRARWVGGSGGRERRAPPGFTEWDISTGDVLQDVAIGRKLWPLDGEFALSPQSLNYVGFSGSAWVRVHREHGLVWAVDQRDWGRDAQVPIVRNALVPTRFGFRGVVIDEGCGVVVLGFASGEILERQQRTIFIDDRGYESQFWLEGAAVRGAHAAFVCFGAMRGGERQRKVHVLDVESLRHVERP